MSIDKMRIRRTLLYEFRRESTTVEIVKDICVVSGGDSRISKLIEKIPISRFWLIRFTTFWTTKSSR